MQQLHEMGVHIGMPIKDLNTRQIRRKMMQLQPNITFFSLNLRGNSLTVVAYGSTDLHRRCWTSTPLPRWWPRGDGVVTQVRALEGQPMVRAGDAVQTGDTLIKRSCRANTRRRKVPYNACARHRAGVHHAYGSGGAAAHRAEQAVYG